MHYIEFIVTHMTLAESDDCTLKSHNAHLSVHYLDIAHFVKTNAYGCTSFCVIRGY